MFSLLDIPYDIQTNIKEVAPNLYQVKSKTKEDVVYTVDMTIKKSRKYSLSLPSVSLKHIFKITFQFY